MKTVLLITLGVALFINAVMFHRRQIERLEQRRVDDVAAGGQPPEVRGVSGHEREELRTELHRMSLLTRRERVVYGLVWLSVLNVPLLSWWLMG